MKRVSIFLLALSTFIPFLCNAQEFKVASFDYNPGDLTARVGEYCRVDLDGRKCALLKVSVADDIVEAQGNVVGDIIKKGMEKWIYIAHDSKHVKLLFDKHHSLMLNFIDYNYPVVSEQMVYDIKLVENRDVDYSSYSSTPKVIKEEGNTAVNDNKSKEKNKSESSEESRKRLAILKWIENYRRYYNDKDFDSLEKLFGEDVLIVTGNTLYKVKQSDDNGGVMEMKSEHNVQSKIDFLRSTQRLLMGNRKIDIEFDNISVAPHSKNENIYGVSLHQNLTTDRYHDSGWLFLLWDFKDPDNPRIKARVWQTEEDVAKYGQFKIEDFSL